MVNKRYFRFNERGKVKMRERVYDKFIEIISYFTNEEIEKLIQSLKEYINNYEEI